MRAHANDSLKKARKKARSQKLAMGALRYYRLQFFERGVHFQFDVDNLTIEEQEIYGIIMLIIYIYIL